MKNKVTARASVAPAPHAPRPRSAVLLTRGPRGGAEPTDDRDPRRAQVLALPRTSCPITLRLSLPPARAGQTQHPHTEVSWAATCGDLRERSAPGGPQWRPAAAAVMRVFLPILMRGPWDTDVAIFTCGSARPDSPPHDSPPRRGPELRSLQERRSGRGLGQPRPRRPRSERAGSATRAAGSPHSRETCEGELSRRPTAQRHRCSDPDSNLSADDNTVQCSGSVLETWMLRNLNVKVKVEK